MAGNGGARSGAASPRATAAAQQEGGSPYRWQDTCIAKAGGAGAKAVAPAAVSAWGAGKGPRGCSRVVMVHVMATGALNALLPSPHPTCTRRFHQHPQENNKGPILELLTRHLAPLPLGSTVLEVASGTGQHIAHFAAGLPHLQWQPSDVTPDLFPSIAAHTAGAVNVLEPRLLDAAWPQQRWATALAAATAAAGDPVVRRAAEAVAAAAMATAAVSGLGRWPTYDAVYVANMTHIAPWAATQGLVAGAAALLKPRGLLAIYGPFKLRGEFTTPSNRAFHERLVARWGPKKGGQQGGRHWRLAAATARSACCHAFTHLPCRCLLPPSDPAWGYRSTDDIAALGKQYGLDLEAIEPMPANNFTLLLRRSR
jgi:SAM-dependent methyltransferase